MRHEIRLSVAKMSVFGLRPRSTFSDLEAPCSSKRLIFGHNIDKMANR